MPQLNHQPHLSLTPQPTVVPIGAENVPTTKTKTAERTRIAERVDRPSTSTHATTATTVSLETIQAELHRLSATAESTSQFFAGCVSWTAELTNAIWSGLFQKIADNGIEVLVEHDGLANRNLGLLRSSLLPVAESTFKSAQARVVQDGEMTVIATPVLHGNSDATVQQVLCVALNLGAEPAEPFLLIAQLIASEIGSFHQRGIVADLDWQIAATAAIAELMSKIVAATSAKRAALLAANELAQFLNAAIIGIGSCQPGSRRTRLIAVSGSNELDRGSEHAQALEAVLDETLIRNSTTTWPTIGDDDDCLKMAHQQLLATNPQQRIVSSPLITTTDRMIGAWVCLLPNNANQHQRILQFAETTSPHLADALEVVERASASPLRRLKTQIGQFVSGQTGKIVLAGSLFVAGAMLVPIPYRIGCECSLRPTIRSFAVAPHDGVLLESFVKPGDLVSANQLLAKMDDRELRLRESELIAELETAEKQRDVHRSSRDAAATQISELDIDRLNAKLELIRFQERNLKIKSAVAGIVLQGDLDDARGAPVRVGDVLAEVAALDQLKVEIEIPESEWSQIKPGQSLSIVLEANPFEKIDGVIHRVRPMSEVRNQQNVFIAEVVLDNQAEHLRPGMKGRTKIDGGWQPLGWVLFHRPAEKVYSLVR